MLVYISKLLPIHFVERLPLNLLSVVTALLTSEYF